MSDLDGKEQGLLMKQVIRKFMKDQLNELNEDKQANNSFVFLENSTLDMLIVYMLMNGERGKYGQMKEDTEGFSQVEIVEELEKAIVDNKKEFEKIIALLKQKNELK